MAFAPALKAQSDSTRSAPISDIRYEIRFDSALAEQRIVRVSMSFDVRNNRPILLSMPAWTAGEYQIRNFARHVTDFSAGENNAPLAWDKTDYDTWRVRPARGGRVTVQFQVKADSLENTEPWAQPEFLSFNGNDVFMYAEDQPLDYASTVSFNIPSGWLIATGLPGSSATRTFSAPSYHELIDHPVFVGRFDLDSMLIAGTWVRLASYPVKSTAGRARATAWEQLAKIIPMESSIFGETPFKTYTVLQVIDSTSSFGAGLEHENSHMDVLASGFVGSTSLASLYAHEIFHAWNVKRLRPAEMWPYRYDRPQPTTLLWISEGITDYYADLAVLRTGIISRDQFFYLTLGKLQEVDEAPASSLEDLSLDAWMSSTSGNELYYPKGSLTGLLIDILIRDATDNRASLDDVMRDLYNRSYKRGKGFTNEDFWSAVTRAAGGKSFSDFYERYVNGREPLPIAATVPLAGMKLRVDELRYPRIGVSLAEDSVGSRVLSVVPGGPAEQAGVKAGDYIVTLGGVPASEPDAVNQFAQKYLTAAPGTPVPLDVKRGKEILHMNAALKFSVRRIPQILNDPAAVPKAVQIRESLLRGTNPQSKDSSAAVH